MKKIIAALLAIIMLTGIGFASDTGLLKRLKTFKFECTTSEAPGMITFATWDAHELTIKSEELPIVFGTNIDDPTQVYTLHTREVWSSSIDTYLPKDDVIYFGVLYDEVFPVTAEVTFWTK